MNLLPAVFGLLGLFVGRRVAARHGLCPHRGKVWGAFLVPLLLLVVMMAQAPLVFMVSMGAAIGAGLTAHSAMKTTLLATSAAVLAATVLAQLTLV